MLTRLFITLMLWCGSTGAWAQPSFNMDRRQFDRPPVLDRAPSVPPSPSDRGFDFPPAVPPDRRIPAPPLEMPPVERRPAEPRAPIAVPETLRDSEAWRRRNDTWLNELQPSLDSFNRGAGAVVPVTPQRTMQALQDYEVRYRRQLEGAVSADVAEAVRRLCGVSGCRELDLQGAASERFGATIEAVAVRRVMPDALKFVLGRDFDAAAADRLIGGYLSGRLTDQERKEFEKFRSFQTILKNFDRSNTIKMEHPFVGEKGTPPRIPLLPVLAPSTVAVPSATFRFAALAPPPVRSATATCMAPADNTAIENDDEFIARAYRNVDARGLSSVAFCLGGFGSVVMLRTPAGAVCSGVRLPEHWVLTAEHCVRGDSAAVRVYHTRDRDAECLRKAAAQDKQHPADLCRELQILAIESGSFRVFEGLDLALFRLTKDSETVGRVADIPGAPEAVQFLVTFAGYGRSTEEDARYPGPLRVAVAKTEWLTSDRQRPRLDLVGIWPDDKIRTSTVICPGDSGGPAFYGRAFGYSDEPHHVFAISSETLGAGCLSDVVSKRSSRVIPLASDEVKRKLCPHLGGAVTLCRS